MLLRLLIGSAIGLLAGAALGTFMKARGGTCPLTCNPIGGALFGALMGAALAGAFSASGRAGKMLDGVPGVKSAAELDAMIAGPRPVLVDFYTDNCPFCVELAPTISALARQYKGRADVVKVNASVVAELSGRYGIQGVPTVLLFAGGKEPAQRWIGVQEVGKYQAALDAAIGPADKRKEDSMTERKGVVTFKGNELTLVGTAAPVGKRIPDFTALGNDLSAVKLSSFAGKIVLLSLVPSLDTPVCDTETRRFNDEASKLGKDVVVLTVSMDLPFAQKRWCAAAGIDRVITLSDHRDASAGLATGMLIKELRLLARAVFVLDRDGVVAYEQVVPEMTHEPDYDAALKAARKLLT